MRPTQRPLCPHSDRVPQRSEMTQCANSGRCSEAQLSPPDGIPIGSWWRISGRGPVSDADMPYPLQRAAAGTVVRLSGSDWATERHDVLLNDLVWLLFGKDDLGSDTSDAGTCQADGARRGGREVEHPATAVGAAVVDRDLHASAAIRHPKLGAETQRAVGAGERVLVEALARRGLAAGFVAVKRRNAGEHAPARR
jgi:hypothetical protein